MDEGNHIMVKTVKIGFYTNVLAYARPLAVVIALNKT
jgi:hypothetical protein